MKNTFYQYIENLQDEITTALEEVDEKTKFREDIWKREEGGGGRTRVIEEGNVFEKGGVNISKVWGKLPPMLQKTIKAPDTSTFFACGLSLVIHPKNPFVPTVHANWRFFELYDNQENIVDHWFGGGQDLTPYYLFEEDAKHFHQICKESCNRHSPDFYNKFKNQCDEYFWNFHRNEARGIGGLFFDHCKPNKIGLEDWFAFVKDTSSHFVESYVPIVERRKDISYTSKHREWQEIRRGRYVEFNLIYDRGTIFGLQSNGRIESILMSLPAHVQWKYDYKPNPNTPESTLEDVLYSPKDWV